MPEVMPNPLNVSTPQVMPSMEPVTPASPESPTPAQGEETGRQDSMFNGVPFIGGMPGMGGMLPGMLYGSSPAGGIGMPGASPFYNGFGSYELNAYGVPLGSFANYWHMERNPTVALAEATADAPIRAAEITYECRDGTPEEIVTFIREQFEPNERFLLEQLSYARGWGFRALEMVYQINRKGQFVLDKAKALMPELTQCLRDEHGNIVGLDNQGVQLTDPRKFIWLAYDGKGCNPYGRSRKENCKKPWLREEALYDLLEYSMNIQVRPFGYVEYPYGLKDSTGASLDERMKNSAATLANNMAAGKFGLIPNPFAAWIEEMVTKGVDVSKIMPFKIEWYPKVSDSGEGFERMFKITNRGIVMGILQPPRSILEGPGTQSDAESHKDSGVMVNEIFLANICLAINKGPIDAVLVQNFGEDARGSVWMKPAPMNDGQLKFNNDLVLKVLGSGIGDALLQQVISLKNIFEKAGVKTHDFDQAKLVDQVNEEKAKQRAMELEATKAKGGDEGMGAGGGDATAEDKTIKASTADDGEGQWVTMDGAHVFIGKGGSITKGPSHLLGKKENEVTGKRGSLNPNSGWKIHLNVPVDENHPVTKAVSEHLKKVGIPHKIGRSGDQEGKGLTAYVGERDKMEYVANELHQKFGKVLPEAGSDVLKDDQRIVGNVFARFDANDNQFHQYGVKGIPHLLEDAGPFNNLSTEVKTRRANNALLKKFGEFYAGTPWYKQQFFQQPQSLSTADTTLDTIVDSHNRLTPDDRKRRKQFLLALLAFFSWQGEKLIATPAMRADDPVFTAKLAQILKSGMTPTATTGLHESASPLQATEKAIAELDRIAPAMAERLNATTAKVIETNTASGQAIAIAVERMLTRSIEQRATAIAEDMSHVAEQVATLAAVGECVWVTADDEKVCSLCGPLHGQVVKLGDEFAPGVRYPVIDTHGNCRCRLEVVPQPDSGATP